MHIVYDYRAQSYGNYQPNGTEDASDFGWGYLFGFASRQIPICSDHTPDDVLAAGLHLCETVDRIEAGSPKPLPLDGIAQVWKATQAGIIEAGIGIPAENPINSMVKTTSQADMMGYVASWLAMQASGLSDVKFPNFDGPKTAAYSGKTLNCDLITYL